MKVLENKELKVVVDRGITVFDKVNGEKWEFPEVFYSVDSSFLRHEVYGHGWRGIEPKFPLRFLYTPKGKNVFRCNIKRSGKEIRGGFDINNLYK